MNPVVLILIKSHRHSAQPLRTQDLFKDFSTKLNTTSLSIHDSQERFVWFMQVLRIAKLPLDETLLEKIVTKVVLRGNTSLIFMSCSKEGEAKC